MLTATTTGLLPAGGILTFTYKVDNCARRAGKVYVYHEGVARTGRMCCWPLKIQVSPVSSSERRLTAERHYMRSRPASLRAAKLITLT